MTLLAGSQVSNCCPLCYLFHHSFKFILRFRDDALIELGSHYANRALFFLYNTEPNL